MDSIKQNRVTVKSYAEGHQWLQQPEHDVQWVLAFLIETHYHPVGFLIGWVLQNLEIHSNTMINMNNIKLWLARDKIIVEQTQVNIPQIEMDTILQPFGHYRRFSQTCIWRFGVLSSLCCGTPYFKIGKEKHWMQENTR